MKHDEPLGPQDGSAPVAAKTPRRRKPSPKQLAPSALLEHCRKIIQQMLLQIEGELNAPLLEDGAKPKVGRKSPPEVLEILVTLLLKLHQEESIPQTGAGIEAADLALLERFLECEKNARQDCAQ